MRITCRTTTVLAAELNLFSNILLHSYSLYNIISHIKLIYNLLVAQRTTRAQLTRKSRRGRRGFESRDYEEPKLAPVKESVGEPKLAFDTSEYRGPVLA